MTTLAQLNTQIAHLNLECVKDFDYFWFMHGDEDNLSANVPNSVYVRRFADLTMEQWLDHVHQAQGDAK